MAEIDGVVIVVVSLWVVVVFMVDCVVVCGGVAEVVVASVVESCCITAMVEDSEGASSQLTKAVHTSIAAVQTPIIFRSIMSKQFLSVVLYQLHHMIIHDFRHNVKSFCRIMCM